MLWATYKSFYLKVAPETSALMSSKGTLRDGIGVAHVPVFSSEGRFPFKHIKFTRAMVVYIKKM